VDMCTVIGAACKLEFVYGSYMVRTVNILKPGGCSNYCALIHIVKIIHWGSYDSATTYWSW